MGTLAVAFAVALDGTYSASSALISYNFWFIDCIRYGGSRCRFMTGGWEFENYEDEV